MSYTLIKITFDSHTRKEIRFYFTFSLIIMHEYNLKMMGNSFSNSHLNLHQNLNQTSKLFFVELNIFCLGEFFIRIQPVFFKDKFNT